MLTTVENLRNNFSKLVNQYNLYQSKLPDYSFLIEIEKEKKVQQYREEGVQNFLSKFKNLKIDCEVLILQKKREINQKKFPLAFSENIGERQLGELKSTSARQLFFQIRELPGLLQKEVQKMIEWQDYGSAYTIFELIGEDENFQNLISLKKNLNEELGVNEIESDLENLKSLEAGVQKVILGLEAGIPFILFLSDELSDEEYFQVTNRILNSVGDSEFERIQKYSIRI